MSLFKRPSTVFGREVPKPEKKNAHELFEENTLQDQIESLRAKISLKERYNKVQSEELEECRVGVNAMFSGLSAETSNLRSKLVEALNAEKVAVRNALRSHREFQLALLSKPPDFAVAWLEDKVFDLSKRLNRLLDALVCKRMKLKDSEQMVKLLEHCPIPGSLKWEATAVKTCHKLEQNIENMKVKLETAQILHSKYKAIRNILGDEKGHYAPALRSLENQLIVQNRELASLKKMLGEAVKFQSSALKNLALTEEEAVTNRKQRKHVMGRMKQAVTKVLDIKQVISLAASSKAAVADAQRRERETKKRKIRRMSSPESKDRPVDTATMIREKKAELERYQERASRLVEAMKVPDLTYIPGRLQEVQDTAAQLRSERIVQEAARDLLLRQRDQLVLIHCHLAYTGQQGDAEFLQNQAAVQDSTQNVKDEIRVTRRKIHNYGETIVDVRLGLLSILDILEEGALKKTRPSPEQSTNEIIFDMTRAISSKIKALKDRIAQLEIEIKSTTSLPEFESSKLFIRNIPIPPRLVRVGETQKLQESDDEDYEAELKVPTRAEIKAKSRRVVVTGKLKRGFM